MHFTARNFTGWGNEGVNHLIFVRLQRGAGTDEQNKSCIASARSPRDEMNAAVGADTEGWDGQGGCGGSGWRWGCMSGRVVQRS